LLNSIRKTYHEFPRYFWMLIAVLFIDRIGGSLVIPFLALYLTQKFHIGKTEVGSMPGEDMRGHYMAVFGSSWGIPSAIGPLAAGFIMDNYNPNWV
jgi:MFS family permease